MKVIAAHRLPVTNAGHIAADCPNPERPIDCYLCRTHHEKGRCPQAGKLTSSLARCSVCIAYYKRNNMQLSLTTHLFNNSGFIERDMCPVLVNVTQQKRAGFLGAHNVCTICLCSRGHTSDRCPDAHKVLQKFMCSEPKCLNRRSLCPNPQQHMGLSSDQIEPRMSRAVEAGIPVTYLNTTIDAREQIEKLKREIETHEKLSESLI